MNNPTPGKARIYKDCLWNSDNSCMTDEKVILKETTSMSMCSHTFLVSEILDEVLEGDNITFYLLQKKCIDYTSPDIDSYDMATSAELYDFTLTRLSPDETLKRLTDTLIKEFDAPKYNIKAFVGKLRQFCKTLSIINHNIELPDSSVIIQFDSIGHPTLLSANNFADLQASLNETPLKTEIIFTEKNRISYNPLIENNLELFFLHTKATLTEQNLKGEDLHEK